jgi:hypothetical protein
VDSEHIEKILMELAAEIMDCLTMEEEASVLTKQLEKPLVGLSMTEIETMFGRLRINYGLRYSFQGRAEGLKEAFRLLVMSNGQYDPQSATIQTTLSAYAEKLGLALPSDQPGDEMIDWEDPAALSPLIEKYFRQWADRTRTETDLSQKGWTSASLN